jgi:hypothetical protein
MVLASRVCYLLCVMILPVFYVAMDAYSLNRTLLTFDNLGTDRCMG